MRKANDDDNRRTDDGDDGRPVVAIAHPAIAGELKSFIQFLIDVIYNNWVIMTYILCLNEVLHLSSFLWN